MEKQTDISRPLRADDPQQTLFVVEPDWREQWWGMPSFDMGDARPQHKITVNFMTAADVESFAKATGLSVTSRSDTAWYPKQDAGRFYYDGPKTNSRYPVCIPSKGRAAHQKTGDALLRLGVTHRFFVEETEYDDYCRAVGDNRVVKMPFHDLGQGSIPARNFIWQWALDNGHPRHWVVDDNITSFYRCTNNRRLRVLGGGFFAAMEDFVDRYKNVALAGPHDIAFVGDRDPQLTPFVLNSRVYSCILIDTSLSHRWRGRYNEDTDLSLRVLKDGLPTLLFRALCMDKPGTSGSKNARPLPGGNTDHVYNTDDHRRAFAESLKEQHPDVTEVVWKFNRWHHQVDYTPFRKNRLVLRDGVVPTKSINDYGMVVVRADSNKEPAAGPTTEIDIASSGKESNVTVETKLFGTDLFGQPVGPDAKRGALHHKFLIPPFSVLNTREGVWQERRRAWLSLGIESEVGRGGDVLGLRQINEAKMKYDAQVGAKGTQMSGTSIFDPVLCECAYRWFCPPGGVVLDPFAGGSVRGVVASLLGLQYYGIDLRGEQVEANKAQADAICQGDGVKTPKWFCGDSREVLPKAGLCDMVWSCPPYADLERYSDDPKDLSTMEYEDFLQAYADVIAKAVAKLRPDRFAAFVVGEVRDKRGHYRNFVGHTVQIFRKAGCEFYNEAILVNCAGTLPVRMGRQFVGGRKMGKAHQNLLVFVKGDAKMATEACRWPGETVEADEPDEIKEEAAA